MTGPIPADRRTPSARERAVFGEDAIVHAPGTREELRELVLSAEAEGRELVPAGLGAHAGVADAPRPDALIVSAHRFDAIETYEPDDFTIGVGAGMPLATLRARLDEHGQEIPADLGRTAAGTAGGLVARAPFGPRAAHHGRLAAFVLGVEGMRGGGAAFESGGMVVKNVAGYQIGKFLVGAHGRGGFLLRVNFRLRSRPEVRALRLARFSSASDALELAAALRSARLEPAVLCVLSGSSVDELSGLGFPGRPGDWIVAWMFEGIAPRVEWLRAEAERIARAGRGEVSDRYEGEPATKLLHWLTAFSDAGPVPRDDLGIARIVVRPTKLAETEMRLRAALRDCEGIVAGFQADAAGVLTIRWTAEPTRVAEPLPGIREAALAHDGWATLLALPAAARRGFQRLLTADPNAALTRRVLDVFGART